VPFAFCLPNFIVVGNIDAGRDPGVCEAHHIQRGEVRPDVKRIWKFKNKIRYPPPPFKNCGTKRWFCLWLGIFWVNEKLPSKSTFRKINRSVGEGGGGRDRRTAFISTYVERCGSGSGKLKRILVELRENSQRPVTWRG
jgi:hypothetical protein